MLSTKGQSMTQNAIGVMIAVVVIAAVAIPVATDALVTDLNVVNNETFNATATDYNYTVADASVSDFSQLDTAQGYETDAQTSEVNTTILDAEAGKVNFEYPTDPTSTTQSVDYDWQPDGYIQGAITRTVVDYIPLALGLSLFIAAISLVG